MVEAVLLFFGPLTITEIKTKCLDLESQSGSGYIKRKYTPTPWELSNILRVKRFEKVGTKRGSYLWNVR